VIESDLRSAVGEGRLDVYYMPQVSLQSGELIGVEALARLRDPDRGLVPAAEFIPVAEESDLVVSLGGMVLEDAVKHAIKWREAAADDLRVTVNVSARQIIGPELPGMVADALLRFDIPPSALCLEMTETAVMEDPEGALEALRDLKDLGVSLAADDFGLGTSTFGLMRRVPDQDVLKIGPTLVRKVEDGEEERELVSVIVAMAHALGMIAIAESVETEGQMLTLRGLGCDAAQGFYIGKPLPAREVEDYLPDGRTAVAPR
jgi:EAL domain-containing protein (putative c-di-GMP-specific phosphodiesterase class I)